MPPVWQLSQERPAELTCFACAPAPGDCEVTGLLFLSLNTSVAESTGGLPWQPLQPPFRKPTEWEWQVMQFTVSATFVGCAPASLVPEALNDVVASWQTWQTAVVPEPKEFEPV